MANEQNNQINTDVYPSEKNKSLITKKRPLRRLRIWQWIKHILGARLSDSQVDLSYKDQYWDRS